MRIAVLVYGRLNYGKDHYGNILESLGDHGIDFFLSSDHPPPDLLSDFIETYQPKALVTDPITYNYDLSKYPGSRPEVNIHNMTCHFINKNRVFKIFEKFSQEHGVKYDVVVSIRIDIMFDSIFNFTDLKNDTIYIPKGYDHVSNGLNDQIAHGKFEVMEKYNSINPMALLEMGLSIPHPESLNYANVHYHKLHIERTDMAYRMRR